MLAEQARRFGELLDQIVGDARRWRASRRATLARRCSGTRPGTQHADLPVAAGRAHRRARGRRARTTTCRRPTGRSPRAAATPRAARARCGSRSSGRRSTSRRPRRTRRARDTGTILADRARPSARGTPADRRAARSRSGSARALCFARQLVDDRDELARQRRIARADARQRRVEIGRAARAACRAFIVPAGCTPVSARQNMMPTRPDVGLVIDDVGAPLLGRHVRQRADERVAAGERDVRVALGVVELARVDRRGRATCSVASPAAIEDARDAEVEHLHLAAIGDEDVARLEIAVNDAVLVRALERAHDRHHQLDELPQRRLGSRAPRESVLPSRYSSTMYGRPSCSPTS